MAGFSVADQRRQGAVGFVLRIGCCTLLDLGFGCLQARAKSLGLREPELCDFL